MKAMLVLAPALIVRLAASALARAQCPYQWQPQFSGTSGQIRAFASFNGELIAGGSFTNAGGTPVNNIARWNGSMWQPLGTGTNGAVQALAVFNNELIAAGVFTTAGGVTVNRIARWNGDRKSTRLNSS